MPTATVTEVPEEDVVASDVVAVEAGAGASVRGMALGLWTVVGGLLAYGIVMTAIKASALFG
jgi:hypothetical protein